MTSQILKRVYLWYYVQKYPIYSEQLKNFLQRKFLQSCSYHTIDVFIIQYMNTELELQLMKFELSKQILALIYSKPPFPMPQPASQVVVKEEHVSQQIKSQNSQSEQNVGKRKKSSLNHNIQKHLIPTVKALHLPDYFDGNSIEGQLATKIWKWFLQTKHRAKQILKIVFGNGESNDIRDIAYKYKYFQFLNFQIQTVIKAQAILRNSAITAIDNANWKLLLGKRKLIQKDQLVKYMISFRHQLNSGPLTKRMKYP